jgi:hypothetical protein
MPVIYDFDAEDLEAISLRRADRSDFFTEIRREERLQLLHVLATSPASSPAAAAPPDGLRTAAEAAPKVAHRQRKPTLASVAKQASKAAIAVARYEIKPDGTVVVVTGRSESTEPNPWLADLGTKEIKQ